MWRLLTITFTANFLIANPVDDIVGVSARIKSMGGAGTALSEDFSATFYNPANLSYCAKNQISLGYNFTGTKLDVIKQLGTYDQVSLGLCLLPVQNLGVGIYVSTGLLNPVDIRTETAAIETQSLLYSDSLRFPSIMAGISYRFMPQLSVGASASMHITGNIDLGMVLPLSFVLPHGSTFFKNNLNILADPNLSFVVGMSYDPISRMRTSLVYRSPGYSSLNINADIDTLTAVKNANIKMLLNAQLNYSPTQVALGVSYQVTDEFMIAADATYYRWSVFQSPFIRATPLSSDAKYINFGSAEKLNLRDTLSPRVGAEYQFKKAPVSVRAGYAYLMSPTLMPKGSSQVFDGDVHRGTLGAGYRLAASENLALLFDAFVAADVMAKSALAGGTVINTGLTLTAEY